MFLLQTKDLAFLINNVFMYVTGEQVILEGIFKNINKQRKGNHFFKNLYGEGWGN
jgi:hypothetical protein